MKVLYIIPGKENGNSFPFSRREYSLLKKRYLSDIQVYYLNTRNGISSLVRSYIEIRNLVKQNEIEIVHAQYGTLTSLFAILSGHKKKVVITFRGSDINGSGDIPLFRRVVSKAFSWLGMHFADSVIFVSPVLRLVSPSLYKNFEIIPSGVDVDIFSSIDKEMSKSHLGLETRKKYLLFYSSHGSSNKRPDLAYASIKELHSRGFEEFEILEVKGGVAANEMPYYINACEATLVLSDREGSPTILQESLVCGVPVVSVDVGDAREMLNGVPNSLIVERKAGEIADGILEVVKVGKIHPTAELMDKISLENCVAKIFCIYQKLGKVMI